MTQKIQKVARMDKPEEDSNGSKLWAFENLLA